MARTLLPAVAFSLASAFGVAGLDRQRSCDVRVFGAVGDGAADDTAAIRAAIAACEEVVLPAGATFLTGPVNLTDDQTLRVDGTLLAAPVSALASYPVIAPLPSYGWSRDVNCFDRSRIVNGTVWGVSRYSPIIGAFGRRNVSLLGAGVVDGQGRGWHTLCAQRRLPQGRPRLVEVHNCTEVRIRGVTLQNSPFWTTHIVYSRKVHLSGLAIFGPEKIVNNDGVDVDSSSDVVIEDSVIDTGDDGIALKSGKDRFGLDLGVPTQNVLVRNISVGRGARGGLAIGSEMSGGIRNVTVRNSDFPGHYGIYIKSCPGRGAYIRDIAFHDVHVRAGIRLSMTYDGEVPGGPVPVISDILFDGVYGSGGCNIDGCKRAEGGQCFNVSFRNVSVAGCQPPPAASDAVLVV